MTEKEFVSYVVGALEKLQIPYFVTGGMAAIAYGEPRFTNDLDVVVDLSAAQVPALLAQFPEPDFYVSEAAVRTAVAKHFQFNIIHPASLNKVDVMILSPGEYDHLRSTRKKRMTYAGDLIAYFAAPEDVILKKLVYFQEGHSEKHLRDIASMMLIRRAEIDRAYITEWAGKLGVTAEWQLVCDQLKEKAGE